MCYLSSRGPTLHQLRAPAAQFSRIRFEVRFRQRHIIVRVEVHMEISFRDLVGLKPQGIYIMALV